MSGRAFWMRTLKLCAGAALAMALVAIGTAHAGFENAGTTAGNFLSLGAGARALSMGGASLALGDDVGGTAWNAAALGWVGPSEVVLSHAGLENTSKQEWGAFGGRIGATQTRWAVTGLYQGDGSFEGRDATGASTGSFSVSSFAFGATVAQQIRNVVTVGLGAKSVNEKLGSVSGSGITFDAGVMVHAGVMGFGFAAQNLGGHMKYGPSSYPFPSNYGVGVAFTHPTRAVRVAVDANFPSAYHPDVRTGVEWIYRDALALRTGYRMELGSDADPLSGPTFGLGAGRNGMWMDYGYLLAGSGPGQHRLGLRFNLGGLGLNNDPFGQKAMPRDFDSAKDNSLIGPPAPRAKKR